MRHRGCPRLQALNGLCMSMLKLVACGALATSSARCAHCLRSMTQPLRCRQILTCRTSRAGARPSQYFRAASKACRRRATAASVGGSQCKGGSEGWAAAAGVSPPAAAGVPSGSEAGVPCLSLAAWASAAAARQVAGSRDQHSMLCTFMQLSSMLVQTQLTWSSSCFCCEGGWLCTWCPACRASTVPAAWFCSKAPAPAGTLASRLGVITFSWLPEPLQHST